MTNLGAAQVCAHLFILSLASTWKASLLQLVMLVFSCVNIWFVLVEPYRWKR